MSVPVIFEEPTRAPHAPPPGDDHGNTRQTATQIQVDSGPTSGKISPAGDVDYFTFAEWVAQPATTIASPIMVPPRVVLSVVRSDRSMRTKA